MELDHTLADSGQAFVTLPAAPGYTPGRLARTEDPEARPTLARGAVVGRYVVLGRLGAGAMGVVYAAHDPELDRKVALKLLLAGDDADASARLLREAQALAKLSHPNVVAVHDVGTHAGLVWIAMEFVAGQTLAAWARLRPRPWPEVLRVLLHAARGVAAAHDAGLVHRDLKPDNIMLGDDGRVRVMDFGLAHGRSAPAPASDPTRPREQPALALHLTRVGAVLGTPAYMAPEQWQGREVGAAADQFAWSVTAWELLYGEPPFAGETLAALATKVLSGTRHPPPRGRRVPAWLRRVVERGLAVAPEQRWPTMAALLQALARARARARLRTAALVAVGLAGAATAAYAYRHWEQAQRVEACATAAAEIDAVWDAGARERVREALSASAIDPTGATAERVLPWLDRQANAWRRARGAACMRADVERRWDLDTRERALWCLDVRRTELQALATALERDTAQVVHEAISAAAGLRDATACADEAALRWQPAPPLDERAQVHAVQAELSQAGVLALAGRFDEGLATATRARERAQALHWPPLSASASLREGALAKEKGAYKESEAAYSAAYFVAAGFDAWEPAADAANALVTIVGYNLARPAEGRVWGRHAALAIARTGDPDRLREAEHDVRLAVLDFAAGQHPAAVALFEQALAIQEQALGPDHPQIAKTLNHLASAQFSGGASVQARALYERARAIRERALGPLHPHNAIVLNNLANVHLALGEFADAKALYQRVLALDERTLGPDHPNVALDLTNLAAIQNTLGESAAALRLAERALAIQERTIGPVHFHISVTLDNLGNANERLGAPAQARAQYERSLAIREQTLGPDHPDVAASLRNLADLAAAAGDRREATALYTRALAISEAALGADHPDVAHSLGGLAELHLRAGDPAAARPLLERAVAIYDAREGVQANEPEIRSMLARVLLALRGDLTRARREAGKARQLFHERGATSNVAEVDAWLADLDAAPAR